MTSKTPPKGSSLTHLNEKGEANMVDVGSKADTVRVARAAVCIVMLKETFDMIRSGSARKGDVIATARIAGIMAAKRTHELVPLCHPLMISKVSVDFRPDDALPGYHIETEVRTTGKTGVEMEALTAASVAALTLYDMAKAVDRGMQITGLRVIEKAGGKSGHWKAETPGND